VYALLSQWIWAWPVVFFFRNPKVSAGLGFQQAPRQRQQRCDVVTHRLQAGADRLKSIQPQQIQACRPQRSQRTGAVAPVAMGVLMELGIADPVPAFQAPAVLHQTQQGFWRGAQAGDKQVRGTEGLALPGALGDHLDDPAGSAPPSGVTQEGRYPKPETLLRLIRQRWSYCFAEAWRLRERVAFAAGYAAARGRSPIRQPRRSAAVFVPAHGGDEPPAQRRLPISARRPAATEPRHQGNARS